MEKTVYHMLYEKWKKQEEINATKKRNADKIGKKRFCKANGLARRTLYRIIEYVEAGKYEQHALHMKHLGHLWKTHYRARYKQIPKDRKQKSVFERAYIIRDMRKDGFSVKLLGTLLKISRAQIQYLQRKLKKNGVI